MLAGAILNIHILAPGKMVLVSIQMRLFTGISLTPNIIERLSSLLKELRPTARINWSPVENLPITLRFIGEWPEDRLPELKAELARVTAEKPIPVTISRFGYFPNPHRPHSLFAGVQAGPELASLARATGNDEARGFHPHVTLARIKASSDVTALRERIAGISDSDFGSFDIHEFHLYLSQPGPRGSTYTKLATYDLMREKNQAQ